MMTNSTPTPPFDIRAELAAYQRAAIALHAATLTGHDLRADTEASNAIAARIVAEFETMQRGLDLEGPVCECGHGLLGHNADDETSEPAECVECECRQFKPTGLYRDRR